MAADGGPVMKPGTVVHLSKTIITQGGGIISTYKLNKGFTVPVLVLAAVPTPDQVARIQAILSEARHA